MSLPHYAPQEYALRAVIAPDPDSIDPQRAAERKIAAYETGSDVATLELEITNDGDSQPNWRLY